MILKCDQISEKHARALLLLNKKPEEHEKLYQKITTGDNIPREQAITLAKEMIGQPATQILKISYTTKEELIIKLEEKLKGGNPGDPSRRLILFFTKRV